MRKQNNNWDYWIRIIYIICVLALLISVYRLYATYDEPLDYEAYESCSQYQSQETPCAELVKIYVSPDFFNKSEEEARAYLEPQVKQYIADNAENLAMNACNTNEDDQQIGVKLAMRIIPKKGITTTEFELTTNSTKTTIVCVDKQITLTPVKKMRKVKT